MKLVFFDIECASVFKNVAKICAFGYCVCDMNFNVLEKRDVLINPKGKFHLTDRKGQRGLVLPYDYDEFKNYPSFPHVYEEIKSLLEDKDNLVFGHSTCNDVRYLSLETKRFKLPPFNFEFYDSQILYMAQTDDFSRQFGLEHITQDLDVVFTPHRAADDAYATMKVVQALCQKNGCDVLELNRRFKVKAGKTHDCNIIRPICKGMIDYENAKKRQKQARSLTRMQFSVFLSKKQWMHKKKRNGIFCDKTFCFSKPIEDDLKTSIDLVEKVYALGGTYSQKLSKSNVYVHLSGDDSARLKSATENENIEVMSLDKLLGMINA